MSVYSEVMALGDKFLPNKPSEDADLMFEHSIGDDEGPVFVVLDWLDEAGVKVPTSLLLRAKEEFPWSDTLADLVDDMIAGRQRPVFT